MQEVFEQIIELLTQKENEAVLKAPNTGDIANAEYQKWMMKSYGFKEAIEIVKQEAEKFGTDINVGSNGWIPCSERLPEEAFGCLVTVMDCNPLTQTDFENILPYFVGYDGETWNDADGEEIPFEVVAWRKLPNSYQPKGD